MIWHIFRKDLSLLWPLALTLALLHGVNATLQVILGPFAEPHEMASLADVLSAVTLLGLVALIVAIVHLDPVPGTSQDWLTRPINRRDLLLAKLLGIVILVQAPLFVADIAESLGTGFGLQPSLAAALWDGISKFLLLSLPAAVFASVSRNLTEVIIGGLALLVLCAIWMMSVSMVATQPPPISSGGLAWIRQVLLGALALGAAIIVLPRQYRYRATRVSRGVILLSAALATIVWSNLPWAPIFALQQQLSRHPEAASAVTLGFEPGAGRFRLARGSLPRSDMALLAMALARRGAGSDSVYIYIPVRVTGIARNSLLAMDRADYQLVGDDGATVYRGNVRFFTESGVFIEGMTGSGAARVSEDGVSYQALPIPRGVYSMYQHRALRLQVTYSLSLLTAKDSFALSALDGVVEMNGGRRCVTRLDRDADAIQLNCVTPMPGPVCVSVTLQDDASVTSNPPVRGCNPDYARYPFGMALHIVNRLGTELPFLDPNGQVVYPVDGPKLGKSRVLVAPYEAQAHFRRQVSIPDIRIGQWGADSTT